MKRFYKILVFFILVFLTGLFVFIKYIDYSLDKKEQLRAAEQSKRSDYSYARPHHS